MILEGRKAIAELLGVSPKRVRSLAQLGAPIRVVGSGDARRYLADAEVLAAWVRLGHVRPPAAT